MESRYTAYDFLASIDRISEILNTSENSFGELDYIPTRDQLTFTNGFYVNCSCISVDIRGSSNLPRKHNRPKLAKLYRVYLSEVTAVMNGSINCAEINIVGDGVNGIFKTPLTSDIDDVFSVAYRISSLVDIMNYKFKKNSIEEITIGIGISYGRALMIKAGYKGSGINDVVWMGDVVNEACHLGSKASRSYGDGEMMVSSDFYNNLNDHNKGLLHRHAFLNCYTGTVISLEMNEWYLRNCK